jgi:hypothetical protein
MRKTTAPVAGQATGLFIGRLHKIGFSWRIFFLAFVLRLVPVLLTRSLGIGLDDMFQYDMLARSLSAGNGFRWYAYEDLQMLEAYVDFDLSSVAYDPERGVPTSFRAPLYPSFLALIYLFTGTGAGRFFAVRLVQAGLGALLAPLTYQIAQRFSSESAPAPHIAAWIVACYPLLLLYPLGLATENLFFLLLLASFLFLLKIHPTHSHSLQSSSLQSSNLYSSIFYPFLSGLFLALTILTRSVFLPFAGLAVLWTWFVLQQKRSAVIVALTMLVVIAPWIVRNSLLHEKITGVESSMGYNLYLGYHPEGDGSFVFGPSLDLIPILDDIQRDQLGTQKALEFIRAEPERFLPLALNRLGFFFGLEKRVLVYFYSNNLLGYIPTLPLLAIAAVILLPFVLVSTSAMLGLSLTRGNPGAFLLYLLLSSYLLPHILILSEDRFHLALVPFFAILAAQAWAGGWPVLTARWRESRSGKIAIMLAVLAVALLFLNWGFELSREADKITALLAPGGNETYFPY